MRLTGTKINVFTICTLVYCIGDNDEAVASSAPRSTLDFGIRGNIMYYRLNKPVTIGRNEWQSLGSPPFPPATGLFPPRGIPSRLGTPALVLPFHPPLSPTRLLPRSQFCSS